MAQKFIYLDAAGVMHEIEGQSVSAGSGDAGKFFVPGADGKWDVSLMPTGIGPQTKSLVASEAIAAGAGINVWLDAGTVKMRNADASAASAGKACHGFVLAAVASAATGSAYFEGEISGLSGLTGGATYFLSDTTPGAFTLTPVTTAGRILQKIGVATSATTIDFEASEPIIRG